MKVKELLKERGMTAKELAARLGMTETGLSIAISDKGNPPLKRLEKIAAALDVEVSELFERRSDFVAFVRDQGKIYTFDTIKALKEFTDAAHEGGRENATTGRCNRKDKRKEIKE